MGDRQDPGSGPPDRYPVTRDQASPSRRRKRPERHCGGGRSVWVAASLKATVLRIDPRSLRVTGSVPLLHGQPEQVAYGDDYVWVTNQEDDSITRIDPRSLSPFTIDQVGDGPSGIAAGAGAVFVANLLDGTVARIDPNTRRVTEPVRMGIGADGVVIAAGSAWVTLHEQ